MYEFLPGQLNNHVPQWSSDNTATFVLITKVSKIRNISQLTDNTKIYKLVKIETEKLLIDEITTMAGIPSQYINLEYYSTNVSADKHIIIELEIFPNVWELDTGDSSGNVFFRSSGRASYSSTTDPSQSYVVFCNPKGDYPPYITELDIPAQKCFITMVFMSAFILALSIGDTIHWASVSAASSRLLSKISVIKASIASFL